MEPDTVKNGHIVLLRSYGLERQRLLDAVVDLSEDQLQHAFGPSIHSIGWQLWHASRWDDRLAYVLIRLHPVLLDHFGPPHEIWSDESLAIRWGLPEGQMGLRDTGTDMEDGAADQLRLPGKDELIGYASRAFSHIDAVVSALPAADLFAVMPGDSDGDTYAEQILAWIEHDARHLGTIEAMRGLLGLRGALTS